jgi:hypothetical protein
MDLSKHNTSVELQCPTCGGTQFEGADRAPSQPLLCAGCGTRFERQDLIDRNGENVSAAVQKMGQSVAKDIAKQLSDAFKKRR